MSDSFRQGDEDEVRAALRHALADRFAGVDWPALHDRIVADAAARAGAAERPTDVLASWSQRAAAVAGVLLAAGVAALLFLSDVAEADAVPPGFWTVAEELMVAVPDSTRLLVEAAFDMEGLLQLMVAESGEEMERR